MSETTYDQFRELITTDKWLGWGLCALAVGVLLTILLIVSVAVALANTRDEVQQLRAQIDVLNNRVGIKR